MSLTSVFFSEVFGTALLVLFGVGVVANVTLARTKGRGADWLLVSFGWGLAVFVGVFAAWRSGGHLNPAVTLGLLASGASEYAPDVPVTFGSTVTYLVAEVVGAVIGAVLAWLVYRKHYDAEEDGAVVLGTFSTGPEIRSYGWNLVTEVIATFTLVYVVIQFGNTPTEVGPLNVALLVVAIGASLGGPTGYAINPARDLGPRIAHALLPIRHKGSSDWGYAWVPVAGPVIGGVLAGLVSQVF
ncbi:MIP/aquaporin family protein [Quadrisphaera sp. INWT6]|uniref:MIP/aquaporin family protein n=1 Tax=Quadrisphaera sp. INWT6 TaxID=2596917 RepID=UPI0018923FE2|nr:MIP/aquaporin family protein [Quadrisphaera sp. INWT6]MBF5081653.1 aquaporin family protein [Quadrisphaera sp. INWT6]